MNASLDTLRDDLGQLLAVQKDTNEGLRQLVALLAGQALAAAPPETAAPPVEPPIPPEHVRVTRQPGRFANSIAFEINGWGRFLVRANERGVESIEWDFTEPGGPPKTRRFVPAKGD